ncbi:hypothetical protein PIECOFPK_02536 [Mycovorax composti]|jgi:hypothetical protein|uniref:Uncharacterized protein n=2 Tax=Chitinophagaceae TaxID=563835 RepID=A0ABZ2EMK8_9BACT
MEDISIARGLSEIICFARNDEVVFGHIVFCWTVVDPQPNALRHIMHYRYGNGAVYEEDVRALFLANPRIQERIFSMINAQLRANPRWDAGSIIGRGVDDGVEPPIRQRDYDSTDWLNSNGNIDEVHWRLIDDYNPFDNRETDERDYYLRAVRRPRTVRVQITIRDPYTWHPHEQRPTQCIHQAMERLKAYGAADYLTEGSAILTMPVNYD